MEIHLPTSNHHFSGDMLDFGSNSLKAERFEPNNVGSPTPGSRLSVSFGGVLKHIFSINKNHVSSLFPSLFPQRTRYSMWSIYFTGVNLKRMRNQWILVIAHIAGTSCKAAMASKAGQAAKPRSCDFAAACAVCS